MIFIVYKTTNLSTKEFYIGAHKQRVNFGPWEFDGYLGSGKRFINNKNKYGKENFKRETLTYSFYQDENYIMEKNILKIWFTNPLCLNISKGGRGNVHIRTNINNGWTPERKKLASERMMGNNNHFYGKHHSKKSKDLNRKKHLGIPRKKNDTD